MPTAAADAPTSAADIARRNGKQPVEDHEAQFVLGIVAQTSGLQDRVHRVMVAKKKDWQALADGLGVSRQAILASINRRQVPFTRVKEIAAFLGVPTRSFIEKQWNCAANDKRL